MLTNLRDRYTLAKREFPILFFRHFTPYQERYWVDFDEILAGRTILSMIGRILLSFVFIIS